MRSLSVSQARVLVSLRLWDSTDYVPNLVQTLNSLTGLGLLSNNNQLTPAGAAWADANQHRHSVPNPDPDQ